jgi:peptide/nickel transport system permease protein
VSATASSTDLPAPRRRARGSLARLLAEPLGLLGLFLVVVVVLGAIFAGPLSGYAPAAMLPADRFQGPSAAHWLGTDQLGRDLLSRVLYGARIALAVALGSTALSLLIGVAAGLAAGYGPRWLDSLLLLLFDALKSFPTVMLGLALVTLIGPSLEAVVLVVVLNSAPSYGRIIRTQTIALRGAEYIMAERALGAGAGRIVTLHILPNVIGPILIMASMDIPVVIAIEAGMSFLGLGVRPPTPSWGSILNDGFAYIRESPWPALWGGALIIITTLGFTFLGEALRDTFDPKLSGRGR